MVFNLVLQLGIGLGLEMVHGSVSVLLLYTLGVRSHFNRIANYSPPPTSRCLRALYLFSALIVVHSWALVVVKSRQAFYLCENVHVDKSKQTNMLKFFFRPLQPDSSQFLHLCDELERRRCHLHDKVVLFSLTALN